MAFMPLDPSWPPHRLQAVCSEASPALIVWAEEGTAGGHGRPAAMGAPLLQLPALPALTQPASAQQQLVDRTRGAAATLQGLPPCAPSWDGGGGDDGGTTAAASRCCYVLYTSGSTGRPLGVRGTEAGVLNRCRWLEGALPFQVREAGATALTGVWVGGTLHDLAACGALGSVRT